MIKPEELLERYRALSKELTGLHDKKCDCTAVSAGKGPICSRRAELNSELTTIENALHMSGEDIARVLAGNDPPAQNDAAANEALRKRKLGLEAYQAEVTAKERRQVHEDKNDTLMICFSICFSQILQSKCEAMEKALQLSKEEVADFKKSAEEKVDADRESD